MEATRATRPRPSTKSDTEKSCRKWKSESSTSQASASPRRQKQQLHELLVCPILLDFARRVCDDLLVRQIAEPRGPEPILEQREILLRHADEEGKPGAVVLLHRGVESLEPGEIRSERLTEEREFHARRCREDGGGPPERVVTRQPRSPHRP